MLGIAQERFIRVLRKGGRIGYTAFMSRVTRYILRQLFAPTLFITGALVGVVWLTQSLRFVDLIVNRGLSAGSFFYLTMLLLPGFVSLILPIALFCAVLFTYHRLSFDSEIVVLRAAGLSHRQLARPALALALGATIVTYGLTLYLTPLGFRTFKDQQFTIRSSYASVLLQEGVFNTLVDGVTVYVRERKSGGELHGILVHDSRQPSKPVTVMAERGILTNTAEGPRFVMVTGNRQEVARDPDQLSLLFFDRYALDLGLIAETSGEHWREPGERYLSELLNPGSGLDDVHNADRMKAEAHKRLVSPLYCLAFTLIALAGILSGEFNRRGKWRRILAGAAAAVAFQAVALGLMPLVGNTPALAPLMYLNIAVAMAGASWILTGRGLPSLGRGLAAASGGRA